LTSRIFQQMPRKPAPRMPQGELSFQEPPEIPEPQGGGFGQVGMMLPMAASSGAMAMMFMQPGARATNYLAGGLMAASSLSMVGMQVGRMGAGGGKQRLNADRRDYLRHLDQQRRAVRRFVAAQQDALAWRHPDPAGLWSIAMSSRLWERQPGDDDFAEVRLAVGELALAVRMVPPQTKPVEDLDPVCASALRRFIRTHRTVPDLPIAVGLPGFARLEFDGHLPSVRAVVRAMLCQLAVFHTPEELRVGVCTSGSAQERWEWVKWLPHALHQSEHDAAGPVRLVSDSFGELERLIGPDDFRERPPYDPAALPSAREPFTVLVVDGVDLPAGHRAVRTGYRNAVVLELTDRGARHAEVSGAAGTVGAPGGTLRLRVTPERISSLSTDVTGAESESLLGAPSLLSLAEALNVAQLVAPYRIGGAGEASGRRSGEIELPALLDIKDARGFDPDSPAGWRGRTDWERLRVPIGLTEAGLPAELDIKEAAQGGSGPHGMIIGATGSGKSELLRTLVLGLALRHDPSTLNMVLTDFKGGATFLGLGELPHTSAVITNLADELPLVKRMYVALHGELVRRQELLRAAGNYASVRDYEKARAAGAPLAPLPSLLIVVDEFSELLAAHQDFLELFVMIGRLGRSLGVHLLLASQRVDEGRIHALEGHLSYRIALRTFSVAESRAVLGVGDAYDLPSQPGNGYLRCGTEPLVRFRAAYVSAPYAPPSGGTDDAAQAASRVVRYRTRYLTPLTQAGDADAPTGTERQPEPAEQRTLLTVLADRMTGRGTPAHRIWLPPLDVPPTLDGMIELSRPPASVEEALRPVLGLVDRPFEQRRDPLTADLTGAAGHVAIVGGTQTGKSTMLRTLISALCLRNSPRAVQFYCVDLGGGSLSTLTGLPHVGGVAGRLDSDRVVRTVAEVEMLLADREVAFQAARIGGMAEYRARRAAGEFAADPFGDVFLVIDGWYGFRQEYERLEPAIQRIASRGLGFGVHLAITASRWSEIRPWLRDMVGSRFELRLGDPIDSEVNPATAREVPALPGRGITKDKHHFISALPRIDGDSDAMTLHQGAADLVQRVSVGWNMPAAPAVRMLPTVLPAERLAPPAAPFQVALGWDEARLEPVVHDFDQHPHLMVFGENESGKTNVLRHVAQSIAARNGLDEVRMLIADARRRLHDAVRAAMQLGYAVTGSGLDEIVADILPAMRQRVPGPEIDPARLPRRDWWHGPRLFVLVDDYDLLVGGPRATPLAPLLDLLPQAAEIGLHLVVARSAAGAARGMNDPVLRRLWELGTPGLLLSCGRDEGAFLGDAKPRQLPPGRAQLVDRRSSTVLVQTALAADADALANANAARAGSPAGAAATA
jgi:S-DNA-T family DNA segregation ATPase FtsK/SpoIIIE